MKDAILDTIYSAFEQWSADNNFCCKAGCSTCCTQNVTITALEGERILSYCIQHNRRTWLLDKLLKLEQREKPKQTTNEYVLACLQGADPEEEKESTRNVCPFLEENICTIYEVRPFSCRCFSSETVCSHDRSATVADHYIYASMAVMQLIEHLSQFNHWGHMGEVLRALVQTKKYQAFTHPEMISQDNIINKVRSAQPIPGFIIPDEHKDQIGPLIETIFRSKIKGKTIEQIFNGR